MISLWEKINDKSISNKYFYVAVFPFAILIYFFYYRWHTLTIYGDDLFIFKYYAHDQVLSADELTPKFRPINDLAVRLIFSLFKKHIFRYYCFNVLMQATIAVLFARVLNLFTKSFFLSCLVGTTIALSRFNLFNITQLYNGGALEALAMAFFLCTLFHILNSYLLSRDEAGKKFTFLLYSLFFANLALYTHERYIVLFPFIMLCLVMPQFRPIPIKRRGIILSLAILSMMLNFVIKKYIYHLAFFAGTGGTNITFSITDAISYFKDAVLSIFLINSGPEFLVGTPFLSILGIFKVLAVCSAAFAIGIFIFYFINLRKRTVDPDAVATADDHSLLFLLFTLFLLCILPAIVTIRLEQRWLQAPLCLYMLMVVFALTRIKFKKNILKPAFICSFVLLFLAVDLKYEVTGATEIYLYTAQSKASLFEQAVKDNVIHNSTDTLFIYEKHKNKDNENEFRWVLGGGYFFQYYGQKIKTIAFVDSADQQNFSRTSSPCKETTQVLYIDSKVNDITGPYTSNTFKVLK